MLSMVREGKICCIIVKDISRFGRNYLEVGDYLEHLFPLMGVRFIAINDGYDSYDYIGTTGGIETAYKSLLYDLYSKDLSVKINSSLQIRRKRGDFIGPKPPFGYQFSDDKKVLTVDPVAAEYIKQIFALACEGYRTGEIARELNKEQIPTPKQYKNQQSETYSVYPVRDKKEDGEENGNWDRKKVLKILKNKVYLGTIVNGKSRVVDIGSRQFCQVPEQEQICIQNRHPAIISHQDFVTASKVIQHKSSKSETKSLFNSSIRRESKSLSDSWCAPFVRI